MKLMTTVLTVILALLAASGLAGCGPAPRDAAGPPSGVDSQAPSLNVLAVETFLADIARNVAGDRLAVEALIPTGIDPHGFTPTPQDVARVAESDVLIISGAGFEEFLDELLQNAGGERRVIEASAGLEQRAPGAEETAGEHEAEEAGGDEHGHEGDPHFWLDPTLVIRYVENIRDGLGEADPAGADTYAANAGAYIGELQELDRWIAGQVEQIPGERRLLVTNHESFGYFAGRYGLTISGTIVPSSSPTASPSAQQLAGLIDHIRATGAPAIFLETGTNPQLAEQVAAETGIKVVTGLYSHSISDPGGPAPTYIDMMRYNTQVIVEALK